MTYRFNLIIYTAEKFWIMKDEEKYLEYVVMERPVDLLDNGKPIEYFSANDNDEAIKKGLEIAKKHGLL
ncbi:hypothetical protein [Desulfoscipio gibsoniae]|uniref:Uncharacterized protein n=1 Tax=Desulfoscipio gibsoniae DSM 7213 TaxID=767817 RepID=R4KWB9_9FIRM|nr:hypothetical protein [Desulfoscipio gibsoniae]AGL03916.1 hypothetical protein Desgi_4692 [Desulfoscipio gibsoniae DSM 7213]